MISECPVTLTVDSSGDATVYSPSRNGRVHAIKYTAGGLHANTDLVITGETTGVAILTDSPSASEWFYPRAASNKATDGAVGTAFDHDIYVLHERIKIVVAQGGNAVTGTITFYIDEP